MGGEDREMMHGQSTEPNRIATGNPAITHASNRTVLLAGSLGSDVRPQGMTTRERYVQLCIGSSFVGSSIAGVIVPAWKGQWRIGDVLASVGLIILILCAYWESRRLQILLSKKIVATIDRINGNAN